MSATRVFSVHSNVKQSSLLTQEEQNNQIRETFDLLSLVNQSYQALDIGQLESIDDLRRALEDVESVKKSFMENNFPSDMESLGLASSITSSEELETFERMVSFFEKRKPIHEIKWEMYDMEKGTLYIKSDHDRAMVMLESKRQEAIEKLINAIKEVEALGLIAFDHFNSPIIDKRGKEYTSKI